MSEEEFETIARARVERPFRSLEDFLARTKIRRNVLHALAMGDALQCFGSSGYGRDLPMERHVRDARMFTIAGGTAQILRTQVASAVLGMKLPQTRDGYRS